MFIYTIAAVVGNSENSVENTSISKGYSVGTAAVVGNNENSVKNTSVSKGYSVGTAAALCLSFVFCVRVVENRNGPDTFILFTDRLLPRL